MTTSTPSLWRQLAAVSVLTAVALAISGAAYLYHHGGLSGGRTDPGGDKDDQMADMPGMAVGSQDALGENEHDKAAVHGHVTVVITGQLRQRLGVTVGRVERKPLNMSVRTVGIVEPDETRVAKVHLKTEGWVDKLLVNYVGQKIKAGDPLLAIYSPQFLTTQQEYLTAFRGHDKTLAKLALERLNLLDVPDDEIKQLETTGRPQKDIQLRSPISGTVMKRDAFEAEYVTAEKELYEIADLSTVWVQAKIYEYELPHVHLDQPATVTVEALPDQELSGKVVFIQPTVEQSTRTVQVRVELSNEDGLLRPGMFAEIRIDHDMGEGLLVPESAVIRTGEHTYAFRADEGDQFVPVELTISPLSFEEQYQVLTGLSEGDRVVTSANFLVDSESRLRFGGGGMAGMAGMDMGGMKMEGMDMKGMDAR